MKKPTKSIITSSLLALAFGAMSVGTTFALFTSEASTAINVQSGTVKVEQAIVIDSVKELNDVTVNSVNNVYTNSIGGKTYVDAENSGVLHLEKWAPGDKAVLIVTNKNLSDVAIKTRFVRDHISTSNPDLYDALDISYAFAGGYSEAIDATNYRLWTKLEPAVSNNNNVISTITVTVEFKDHDNGEIKFGSENKDNKYQNTNCDILFYQEAVQGNATTDDILNQINFKLEDEALLEGKNQTMHDALQDLNEDLVNAIKTRAYVWHAGVDQFFDFSAAPADAYKYFMMYSAMPEEQSYSIYANAETWAATVNLTGVGFDAGNASGITAVNYVGAGAARENTIRTNSTATALTINAPLDTVHHYGDAGSLNIIAVANSSYHENGKVNFVEIAKGRIALEKTAEVSQLHLTAKNATEGFEEIIIAKDPDATKPEFTRDPVSIPEAGRLVVALQESTDAEADKDFVWLKMTGIYEQITVSDNNESAGNNWVNDSNKSDDTKDTAKEIANNISVTIGSTSYTVVASGEDRSSYALVEEGTSEVSEDYTVSSASLAVQETQQQEETVVTTTATVVVENTQEQEVEATTTVENGISEAEKEAAKEEAEAFAGGTGTQADPYLVLSVAGLNNIGDKCGADPEKLTYFKLVGDITVSNDDMVAYSDYWHDTRLAVCPVVKNAVIDGNNHEIKGQLSGGHVFGDVRESKISSLNVTITGQNTSMVFYSENIEMSNVVVDGEIVWLSSNQGAFIVYPRYNVTMTNCVNKAELSTITGDSTMYCAVFFGYGFPNNSRITMTNCSNKGSLTAGRASLMMANCSYGFESTARYIDFVLTSCSNDGQIVSLSDRLDNNLLVSIIADKEYAFHFTIEGETYTSSTAIKWTDALPSSLLNGTGSFVKGASDTLAIKQNADKTFTITASSKDAVKYIVSVGVYTGTPIGSSRTYVKEEIDANGSLVTSLKNLKFIDNAWIQANPSAQMGTLAGNTVYTLDEETYYLVNNPERCNVGGTPKAAEMISVTAVDTNGRILSVASLLEI